MPSASDSFEGITDRGSISYFARSPELLAEPIVFVINRPWGVSIGDVTVRAIGDGYVI